MAKGKPSTSRNEDTVESVGEPSCSDGSTYPKSVPSAIAAESPSFLTWLWIHILTPFSRLWGARGGGLSGPRVLGLASRAQQQMHEDNEPEVLSRIAASKSSWSEVPGRDIHHSVSIPCPNRLSVWEELKQSAPRFFRDDWAEVLELGRLIAEGGQAQIFEAKMKEHDVNFVLKVFKLDAQISLADLKSLWPRSMRKGGEDGSESRSTQGRSSGFVFEDSRSSISGNRCLILGATLLKDGRFAFVMERYWGDLRTLIDLKVEENNTRDLQELELLPRSRRREQPPFSFLDSIRIMSHIARGMQGLHAEGVLHRDLKAANVLIKAQAQTDDMLGEMMDFLFCKVADYECAMFVQGTGFWRAPEVLQELQKDKEDRNREIWTEKVDVYSFGMTCYEILTGQIPFDGHTKGKWDNVIRGERPSLPNYIFPQLQELVEACWHAQPSQRPSFEIIVGELDSLQKVHTTWS